jgi:hypothetical protein
MANVASRSGQLSRSNKVRPQGQNVNNQAAPTIAVCNLGGSGNPDLRFRNDTNNPPETDFISLGTKRVLCAGVRDGKRRKAIIITTASFNGNQVYVRNLAGVLGAIVYGQQSVCLETDDDLTIEGSAASTFCTVLELFYE